MQKQDSFINSTTGVTLFGGAGICGKSYAVEQLIKKFGNYIDCSVLVVVSGRSRARELFKQVSESFRSNATVIDSDLTIIKGSTVIKIGHLEGLTQGMHERYGCTQISKLIIDEVQKLDQQQLGYLVKRIRTVKHSPEIFLTCTAPKEQNHWLTDLVRPYLTHEGLPLNSMQGVTRHIAFTQGGVFTASNPDSLKDVFRFSTPMSFTYISATYKDNDYLLQNEPDYCRMLESLNKEDRETLCLGKWKV